MNIVPQSPDALAQVDQRDTQYTRFGLLTGCVIYAIVTIGIGLSITASAGALGIVGIALVAIIRGYRLIDDPRHGVPRTVRMSAPASVIMTEGGFIPGRISLDGAQLRWVAARGVAVSPVTIPLSALNEVHVSRNDFVSYVFGKSALQVATADGAYRFRVWRSESTLRNAFS